MLSTNTCITIVEAIAISYAIVGAFIFLVSIIGILLYKSYRKEEYSRQMKDSDHPHLILVLAGFIAIALFWPLFIRAIFSPPKKSDIEDINYYRMGWNDTVNVIQEVFDEGSDPLFFCTVAEFMSNSWNKHHPDYDKGALAAVKQYKTNRSELKLNCIEAIPKKKEDDDEKR